jgi:membrane protein DedA with SNARE-associated domain
VTCFFLILAAALGGIVVGLLLSYTVGVYLERDRIACVDQERREREDSQTALPPEPPSV